MCYNIIVNRQERKYAMNTNNSGGDIRINNRVFAWFDNFWYHYKWQTVAIAFITVVLTICITQCSARDKQDAIVLYGGPHQYTETELAAVRNELADILPADYNEDGQKTVGLVTYRVMTAEQLKAYQEAVGRVDTSFFTNEATNLSNYMMTGETAILLVDESQFEMLCKNDRLRDLSEVFPTLPESAIDNYGIDFTKTSLYANAKYLGSLPEGTVLCLHRPILIGDSGKDAEYAKMTAMFAAMAR